MTVTSEPSGTSRTIGLVGTFTVKAGRLQDLDAVLARMHAVMREREPGALAHHWYVDASGAGLVREEYVDSAAALAHLSTVRDLLGEVAGLVRFTSMTVIGTPSAELRAVLDAFAPTYLAPLREYVPPSR